MDIQPVSRCPFRSPIAVSDALAELLKDKVVCELGCAEGDNLLFMGRYAKSTIGVELDPKRYEKALARGISVVVGNYREMRLPKADVYYFWPNIGAEDNEFLVYRILANPSFHGTIVVGADTGYPPEVPSVERIAKLGRLVEVPFNEGTRHRQSGIFLLAIIHADEARIRLVDGI